VNFDEGLDWGRLGEKLVETWLWILGVYTVPGYEFAADGAPTLRRGDVSHVIPDLDCAGARGRFWLEVKSYSIAAWNRNRKCLVHGVSDRLWADYQAVARVTRTRCLIAILEVGYSGPAPLLVGDVEKMATWSCECSACKSPTGWCKAPMKRGVYWRRDAMTVRHQFTEAEIAPMRLFRDEMLGKVPG